MAHSTSFQFRQLRLPDMDDAARVHRASFDERLPWLAGLHTPEEDRWFFRERVSPACAVWGAFRDAALIGIIAFREGWIDQLYILPHAQARGAGTSLLNIAKSSARHLSLRCFQRNAPARRFYEHNGFVPAEQTDGAANEEREPDILYRWQAPG